MSESNAHTVETISGTFLYSYKTPVAVILNDGKGFKTSTKFSATTSKHVNKFLQNAVVVTEKPQDWIELAFRAIGSLPTEFRA